MALFAQLQPKSITVNINHYLYYILRLFLLTIILNGLDINIVAAQVQQFGQAGRDGVDGRPGQNGISGSDMAGNILVCHNRKLLVVKMVKMANKDVKAPMGKEVGMVTFG